MTTQTSYGTSPRSYLLGQVTDMRLSNILSKEVEDATLAFGALVVQGTAENQVKKPAAQTFTAVGAMAGTNTGAATITASPPVAGPAKSGEYELVCVLGGSGVAARWEMRDPDGVFLGIVNGATAATLGSIGPFTIADPGTDPAAGDRATITVTKAGGGTVRGVSVRDTTLAPGDSDAYQQKATAGVLDKGPIAVLAGATVAAGDDVYYIPATNKFTNVAGVSNVFVPRTKWDTSGTDGNLAVINLNLS